MNTWITFIGIFVGVLLRTLLPALRKALEATPEKPFKWDYKYTSTAVLSIILALFVPLMALPQFTLSEYSNFLVFKALTFALTGSGINGLINETERWLILSPSRVNMKENS